MSFEHTEQLTVEGHTLEYSYLPAVRPGLPVAVFLHEGLGSCALWRGFPMAVAQHVGCAVLVYSRAGNGYSSALTEARTARYMHDEALAVLPAMLALLRVDDVALIGHSDGASIALLYAAFRPQSVRALVLQAPHVFVEDISVRAIAAMREAYETGGLRERMARYHADASGTFYGWNDIWLSPQFSDWTIEPELTLVRAPVLLIQGRDDEYGTLAQFDAIEAAVTGPVDRIVLSRCRHAPYRDRATLIEAVVSGWLREQLTEA